MSALRFHDLTVKRVSPEAAGAVAITLAIPDEAKDSFAFEPGQFLTLRANVAGQDVRRSYSISSPRSRLAARGEHVARLQALQADGRLVLAGPCPAIDANDPGPAGFTGSVGGGAAGVFFLLQPSPYFSRTASSESSKPISILGASKGFSRGECAVISKTSATGFLTWAAGYPTIS